MLITMRRSKLLSKVNNHVINSMIVSSLSLSSYSNIINNSRMSKFSNKFIFIKNYNKLNIKAFSSSYTIESSTTTTTATASSIPDIPIASYLSRDELNCRVLNVLKSIPFVPTVKVNLHHYFITGMM